MPKDIMEVRISAAGRLQREEQEAEATGMVYIPSVIFANIKYWVRPFPDPKGAGNQIWESEFTIGRVYRAWILRWAIIRNEPRLLKTKKSST